MGCRRVMGDIHPLVAQCIKGDLAPKVPCTLVGLGQWNKGSNTIPDLFMSI